nr:MAG TPA_asm: HTH domain protein [Caudoviricetes sp.]
MFSYILLSIMRYFQSVYGTMTFQKSVYFQWFDRFYVPPYK